jgi:type I restriction enzyme, S subunit
MISLKFIPLSFITSNDDIIKQIKNTVVFSHLFETCKETTLNNYIETTQYGFTASALENGSHRLVRITDIHHSKVNWESVPFCDCNDEEKYLLKDNDILVARTGGTTGKSFFVENPPLNAVFASYLIRIRLKKNVNVEFIKAFLNSYCFWSQIVEMKAGSAQPNVNAEKLKILVMPDCDLETQAKAVRLINEENNSDSIRERINSVENVFWNNNQITAELSHQLELVRQLRQAFLREAMQGKLVPQDEQDEPAEILLEKIKAEKEKLVAEKKIKKDKPLPEINDEEIPFEIPDNWIWCRLGEIGTFTGGGTPSMSNANYWNGDIDWISPKDMKSEFVSESQMKITELAVKNSTANMIPTNSLLIVGRSGILKRKLPVAINTKDCTVNQDMKVIIPYNLQMSRYLQLMLFGLQGIILKDYVKFGMTVHSLKYKEFEEMPIPLPPLAEQKRIVEKLEKLMKYCDQLEANIRESKKNAESLLQVALKEALGSK